MTQTGWDDYLVSVPQMDGEHLELMIQVDEFSTALDSEVSRAELEMRLTILIDCFQKHFDSEEGLMRTNSFPRLGLHSAEHRRLIGQMSGLRNDFGSGTIRLCHSLVIFVRMWAEQHMTAQDAEFADFLHAGKALAIGATPGAHQE
jgi:hemerythrin